MGNLWGHSKIEEQDFHSVPESKSTNEDDVRKSVNLNLNNWGRSKIETEDNVPESKSTIDDVKNLNNFTVFSMKLVERNPEILLQMLDEIGFKVINQDLYKGVYVVEELNYNDLEYIKISKLFNDTSNSLKIRKIEKIHNSYIFMQYNLKKWNYSRRGVTFEEKLLFHGTKKRNLDGICTNNFDWRLGGSEIGVKYGKGVSFSNLASYSSHYGDEGSDKIMIVAKVLIGKTCKGVANQLLPRPDCDTTTNEKNTVFVKYEDNVFYPNYVVFYSKIKDIQHFPQPVVSLIQPSITLPHGNCRYPQDSFSLQQAQYRLDNQPSKMALNMLQKPAQVIKNCGPHPLIFPHNDPRYTQYPVSFQPAYLTYQTSTVSQNTSTVLPNPNDPIFSQINMTNLTQLILKSGGTLNYSPSSIPKTYYPQDN